MNSIECQIIEGGTSDFLVVGDGTDNLTVYLNSVLVNQAYRVKPSRGKTQIQSEGAELYVRKVNLSRLPSIDY